MITSAHACMMNIIMTVVFEINMIIVFKIELNIVIHNKAEQVLIRMQQDEEFPEKKARFSKGECVSRFGCLRYLDAILGKDGLLRVGGGLENAPINVDQRLPPILHGSHQITKLLIHHLHVAHYHAGPSTLMGILAAKYYVLRRLAVRNVVRCHLQEEKFQLMGT